MQFEEDVQGYLDWIGAAEDISDEEDNEGKENGKESSKSYQISFIEILGYLVFL